MTALERPNLATTSNHSLETLHSPFLARVESELSHLVGQPLERKKEFVDWLGGKEVFPQFIQALLQNPSHLDTVARRSFLHKNGFDVLQLFMTDDFELRIHIWPQQDRPGQENIHNHRWDLASKILLGTLHQELFIQIDNSASVLIHPESTDETTVVSRKWFKCSPVKDYFKKRDPEGVSKLYQMSQVTDDQGKSEFLLQKILSPIALLKMGQSYSLDQSRFHRIVRKQDNEFTATLMINTGPYATACNVFSTLNLLDESASNAKTFTYPELKNKLEDLLKRFCMAQGTN